ncbi:MAG: lipocalin family protein [Defluviitaleaceae bacterium]|nr:lipocalin family protein [Defluviitaleaceae bacterium]
MRKFFATALLLVLTISLTVCGNNGDLPRNVSRALEGTWELYESNMWGVSDTLELRRDGTGTMSLGAIREDFTWSVDGEELIIVQGGGLLTIAYTITELSDSILSYEADIPGLGFLSVTYIR